MQTYLNLVRSNKIFKFDSVYLGITVNTTNLNMLCNLGTQ